MSSADRDARIAAPVSEDRALVDAYGESVEQAMIASTRSGATYKKYAAARGRCRDELVSALCSRAREIEELRAELRAALSREEEAKKDAERYRLARDRFVAESEGRTTAEEFDSELDKEMQEWRASAMVTRIAAKHGYHEASHSRRTAECKRPAAP